MKNTSEKVKNRTDEREAARTDAERPRYTCADYRDEMRLMGMHRRLAGAGLDEAERRHLEAEIEELQRQMEMD